MLPQKLTDWPSLRAIRFPMVLIGSLNVLLLGLASKLNFTKKKDQISNLLVVALYATLPLIVFGSRMALADNLLATWLLLIMLVLKLKVKYLVYPLVVLAFLTKVQGAFLGLGLMIYFWLNGQKRQSLYSLIALSLGAGLFFLYGSFYNLRLFLAVQLGQSQRKIGFFTLAHRFFFHPTLASHLWPTLEKPLLFLAGLIMIFKSRLKKKDAYLLPASFFIAYLIVALVAFDQLNINGWYEYAIYPVLFFGVRAVIKNLLDKPQPLKTWAIWLVLVMPMVGITFNIFTGLNQHLIKFMALVPAIGLIKVKNLRFQTGLIWLMFISLLIFSGLIILNLSPSNYSQIIFDLIQY